MEEAWNVRAAEYERRHECGHEMRKRTQGTPGNFKTPVSEQGSRAAGDARPGFSGFFCTSDHINTEMENEPTAIWANPREPTIHPMLEWSDDLKIRDTNLYLDSRVTRPLCFVSH